jgi:hypothetical protein
MYDLWEMFYKILRVKLKVNNFYSNNSGENKMGAACSGYGEATHSNIIRNPKDKRQLGRPRSR